jgi:AraC-like DNA-binding protein
MRFELTTEAFEELLAEAPDGGLPLAEARPWPARVGHGTFGCIEVRPGVVFYLLDLLPATDVSLIATPGDGYLEFGYHLRGHAEGTIDGARNPIRPAEGQQMAVCAPPEHGGAVHFTRGCAIVTVALGVAPGALMELIPTPESGRAAAWRCAMRSGRPVVETPRPLAPRQRAVAHQVLACPFIGGARALFMESKALELLACEVSDQERTSPLSLSPDDELRIRAAAELLRARLDDPPALAGLARQAGINEFKLKRGFRTLFGTTVFGYLRAHRLETARELLTGGHVSVMEASLRVGYACPSRFASAFRRHFGVPPSTMRRRH